MLLELGFWFRNSLHGATVLVKSTRWTYDGTVIGSTQYQLVI